MSDYYDLLGVDAGADKDAIKAAYRNQLDGASQAERAKLNKAWNVLSDPVQRERYDDARAEGWLDDTEADAEETAPAPRRGGRAAAAPRDAVPVDPRRCPPWCCPTACSSPSRARAVSRCSIDFSILFVLYVLALSLVLPAMLKSQYPAQTKRIDAINRNIDTLDTFKSNADDRANRDKPSAADRKQARTDKAKFDQDIDCLASTAAARRRRLQAGPEAPERPRGRDEPVADAPPPPH